MAHVQVGNDAAKAFYEGLGFKEDEVYVSCPFQRWCEADDEGSRTIIQRWSLEELS